MCFQEACVDLLVMVICNGYSLQKKNGMREEKNCSPCNKKYKAYNLKYVPCILKYMPYIFDENKYLKHRNLQKAKNSLNICRRIQF